jgi:REP element-mobilizing transposase RayT
MMKPDTYKNKYRIQTTRLPGWDYGWNGVYFVTICTQHRIQYFGSIEHDQMQLSDIGALANEYWNAIPEHFPFVRLGAYVIMPNHVHGIIIIEKPKPVETQDFASLQMPTTQKTNQSSPVETQDFASLQSKNRFGPQSKNLASIIRGYKIGVTISARVIDPTFVWQSRYYDHIIRNDEEYNRITDYIVQNPTNWEEDEQYEQGNNRKDI